VKGGAVVGLGVGEVNGDVARLASHGGKVVVVRRLLLSDYY
jgi:hypothetical protein